MRPGVGGGGGALGGGGGLRGLEHVFFGNT